MNLLGGNIKPIYFKYLSAAFGSAMITLVYSLVDMAMVGQYQGPDGTAALVVIAPVWNIIYSPELLMGIGGSVIFAFVSWAAILFFDKSILLFFGAGLATAAGAGISLVVMLSHFLSKKNTLSFRKPTKIAEKLWEISVTGFPTFFIDIAMGILTVLQIMKYLGSNALAVYGPVINVSTVVQCCAYSVGQAAQPIISINFIP